jgi:ATP-dependent helicase/nuclease subunit A
VSRNTDAEARECAVRTYDRNVVVIASAGTGKTSLLVERLLNQVIETELPLSAVAAITFTEKAATEMRLRMTRGFELLTKPDDLSDLREESARSWHYLKKRLDGHEVARRAEEALHDLPLSTVTTIHGFCARLLRQNAHRLGLPPDFQVDEGFGYQEIKRDLWEDFLIGPEGPNGTRSDLWGRALHRLDLGELRKLATRLADYDLWSLDPGRPIPSAINLFGKDVVDLLGRVDRALEEKLPEKGIGSFLGSVRRVLTAFMEDGPQGLRRCAEENPYRTGGDNWKTVLESGTPTRKSHPEAVQCGQDASKLLRKLMRVDDEAIATGVQAVHPFGEAVRSRAVSDGQLPFQALLALARALLAQSTDVRRQLGRRYRLVLVDEFQDTDPLQYEILFFVAEDLKTEPAADPFAAVLAPGKLFVVGDPKQSIYGFRQADIAACQYAIRRITDCGGKELSLTTTWRAVPEVVDPLHRLFELLFNVPKGDPDLNPTYAGMESGRDRAGDGPRVEVWTVPNEQGRSRKAEQARRVEANAIAEWIAREWKSGEDFRRSYRDIALLFRSFSQVHLYAQALRRWGIPFSLARSRTLFEQPEAQNLWAVLRALANPTDAPAVLGVLRSPLGGVADEELARYASSGDARWCYTETEPDPSRFPGVASTYSWLGEWYELAQVLPADRIVTALLEESALVPVHAAAPDGGPRTSILRLLSSRIAALARAEPSWALPRVLEAFETVAGGSSPRMGEAGAETIGDAVQLLTFHGAKGLEFDVVFVVDLASQRVLGGGPDLGAEVGTLHDPRIPWVRLGWQVWSGLSIRAEEEALKRERAEARRLWYVACTRARERLILVHAPRGRREQGTWTEYLGPWGYDPEAEEGPLPNDPDVSHRVRRPSEEATVIAPSRESIDWLPAIERAEQASSRAKESVSPDFERPSGVREEMDAAKESSDDGPRLPWMESAKRRARAVGIAAHEVLERWSFHDPDEARAAVPGAAMRAARAVLLDPEEVEAATSKALEPFLGGDLAKELATVEVLGREVPFLLDAESRRWSGTIDLIYRRHDGRTVVADYKTDSEVPEEAPEGYREQLRVYGQAVQLAFPDEGEPVLELLYVREGKRLLVG